MSEELSHARQNRQSVYLQFYNAPGNRTMTDSPRCLPRLRNPGDSWTNDPVG